MAILVDENTRFIVQGSNDQADPLSPANLPFYASSIVGYVSMDGAGLIDANRWLFTGASIFANVREAIAATGANASIVRSAPDRAAPAIEEAIDAGLTLVIVMTDIGSAADRERIRARAVERGVTVVGPCSPGLISPGACQVGTMPGYIHTRGKVGILSRSGARCHEAALQTTAAGLGQSTVVALGRAPIDPSSFLACFELLLEDPQTEGIVLLGDAHGRIEEEVAGLLLRRRCNKPVVAYIEAEPSRGDDAWSTGEVLSIGDAMAARKIEALRAAGVIVTDQPAEIGQIMRQVLEVKAAGSFASRPKRDFATAMRQVEQVCYEPDPIGGAPEQARARPQPDFAAAMRQVEQHCYDGF